MLALPFDPSKISAERDIEILDQRDNGMKAELELTTCQSTDSSTN